MTQKCGFVAVLGASNVGKSTLVNRWVGSKVSIVSRKVQTTRQRVLGITLRDETQIILVDTPGIFEPHKPLETAMVATAWSAVKGADALMLVVDASRSSIDDTVALLGPLAKVTLPKLLLLNKIDLVPRERLLGLTAQLTEKSAFDKVFMISAVQGDGVEDVMGDLKERLPEGPWLYPADQLSDLPLRILAAEITREQVFHFLHEELPYEIAVETEKWEETPKGDVKISQVIHVNRPTQRKIVLGAGGTQIKKIGERARQEVAAIVGQKVHLFLHVKVTKDWMHQRTFWNRLYGTPA